MNTQRNNILCLGFWSPPLVRPRAIALGKTIPELVRQGAHPVLMTYKKTEPWNINIPIETIPEFAPKGIWKLPALRTIAELLYYKKLLHGAKKIITKHKITAIVSFANPQAANILGALIHKCYGIKFIAHFSDPWFDNPYKTFSRLSATKVKFLEKFIIRAADRVIFTNDAIQAVVMKKYPECWRAKTLVIPQAYNPNDYPKVKTKNDRFVIRYIGVCYKDRSPEFFFASLRHAINNNPDLQNKIAVEFIGATNPYASFSNEAMSTLIAQYKLEGIVRSLPAVPHHESLALMSNADALLVIDANFANTSARPSKLMDYAGSRTPIIGIAPHGGPIEQMLNGLGFKNFSYDEQNELANYIAALATNATQPKINETFLQQFNISVTTKQLIDLCEPSHPERSEGSVDINDNSKI